MERSAAKSADDVSAAPGAVAPVPARVVGAYVPPHRRPADASSSGILGGSGGSVRAGGSSAILTDAAAAPRPHSSRAREPERRPRRGAIPHEFVAADLACDASALPAGLHASFCAAGVLPWRRSAAGALELLLAVEPDNHPPHAAALSLLFGKVAAAGEDAAACAVREFDEEAGGVLGAAWLVAAAAALRAPPRAAADTGEPADAVDILEERLRALAVAGAHAASSTPLGAAPVDAASAVASRRHCAVWHYASSSVTYVAAAEPLLSLGGAPGAEALPGRHATRVAGLSEVERKRLEWPALSLHWVPFAALCEHRRWSGGENAAAVAAGVPAPLRGFIRNMLAERARLRLLLDELATELAANDGAGAVR